MPETAVSNLPPGSNTENRWYIYIIEADDGSLYTGITNNLARRWQQHCTAKSGAKFFRGRKPAHLRFVEQTTNRSLASQREAAIKKLSRAQKLALIKEQDSSLLITHLNNK